MTDRRSWKVLGRLIRWNACRTMSHYYFFPTLVQPQPSGERPLIRFLKMMTALGLQPFLTYPAAIKLRHKGVQKSFDSPQKAEDFISSLSQRKSYAEALQGQRESGGPSSLRPGRRGLKVGMEAIPTAWEKMVAGWRWILAKSLFLFFFFPLSPGILFLFIRHSCLFAGKTNTLFSFLEGTNGE